MVVGSPPSRPSGTLGSGSTSGMWGSVYEDLVEHVPDLLYPTSVATYARMRTDASLKSIVAAYVNPIRSAPAWVDPDGSDDLAVRAVADSLGLPILGEDRTPGRQRNRAVRWAEHLRLAALSIVFGHYGFAPAYAIDGTRVVLAELPERKPETIDRIHIDDTTGALLGVTQRSAGTPRDPDRPQIKARDLVWYAHEREGSAWWGQSILRAAFGPWLLKQEALRVQATSLRRFGAGTPVMEPLPGTNPTQGEVQQAMRAAQAVRVGDSGGVATPGFTLRIKGVEGTIPDSIPFLRYLDEQMARQALFSLLDLSGSPNGSRALGDTFLDVLAMALQSVADELAGTATEQIAARVTDWTIGEGANVPKVVIGTVISKEEVVAASISDLIQSGALTHDPDLEAWLRKALSLPAMPATNPTTPPPPAPVAARRQARAAVAVAQAERWRALTDVEAAAGLDPDAIAMEQDTLEAATLAAWATIAAGWHDQLVADIEAALTAGDVAALAALTVDTAAAEAALVRAVADAVEAGVRLAVDEAAAAGVTIDPASVVVPDMAGWARGVAAVLAAGLAASAGKEALRLADGAVTPADVAAGVAAFLAGLTGAAVQEAVGGVIAGGIGSGRLAAVAAAPAATYTHSAIMDRATCGPCAAADGTVYPSLAAAEQAFTGGRFSACEGRWRCRCVIATTWGGA